MTSRISWLCIVGGLALAACSSGGSDDPPTLDRIDGPAVVDPSYDPFAVATSSPPNSTSPPTTSDDG